MNTSEDYHDAYRKPTKAKHPNSFEFTFSIRGTTLSGKVSAVTVAGAMQAVMLRYAKLHFDNNLSYPALVSRANAQFNGARPVDFSLDSREARATISEGAFSPEQLARKKRAQKIVLSLSRNTSV